MDCILSLGFSYLENTELVPTYFEEVPLYLYVRSVLGLSRGFCRFCLFYVSIE